MNMKISCACKTPLYFLDPRLQGHWPGLSLNSSSTQNMTPHMSSGRSHASAFINHWTNGTLAYAMFTAGVPIFHPLWRRMDLFDRDPFVADLEGRPCHLWTRPSPACLQHSHGIQLCLHIYQKVKGELRTT